jgi:crotonobetainyl-CoA:carnitine CoA-transferase CaiB-like acyl-CoA transferase
MPPLHGEHTDEVLRELGYADDELESLRAEGTIMTAEPADPE